MEIEQLLLRIHSGRKLKEPELREVADILRAVEFQEIGRNLSADDIYLLLSALARNDRALDQKLFEKFFDFQDPTTASLVSRTLCSSAEGRSEYMERLLNFALGSAWDREGDVQQEAIELLGEFVSDESPDWSKRVLRVVQFLLDLFDDTEAETQVRQWAYVALLTAGGLKESELPSRYAILDFSADAANVRWEIVEKVRRQLSEGSSS